VSFKRVRTTGTYTVGQNEVFLTVSIGDAQIGGSIVLIGSKAIGRNQIEKLSLGDGADLKGKSVKIKTTVADVNDQSNRTSVTYKFSGGPNPLNTEVTSEVDNDGDSMVFNAKFALE
jgi:hypothetical protein